MDLIYNDYIDFINHLFLQEFVDEAYHYRPDDSTVDALTIL